MLDVGLIVLVLTYMFGCCFWFSGCRFVLCFGICFALDLGLAWWLFSLLSGCASV